MAIAADASERSDIPTGVMRMAPFSLFVVLQDEFNNDCTQVSVPDTRDKIEAKIVKVTSIVEGEYAENEIRKDFTPFERLAISTAVEQTIGDRQGERTDKSSSKLRAHGPEVAGGQRTSDFVAERVGFGTGRTYHQAKKVVPQVLRNTICSLNAALDLE